jgi:hypothetical protein
MMADVMIGKKKFDLGRLVYTPAAMETCLAADDDFFRYLARHQIGDWGDLDPEDKKENDFSVAHGYRILSAYTLKDGQSKIWIITEADRSVTTILLPEDY